MCDPGFMGQDCQLGLNDGGGAGRWWRVSEGNPYAPPRTGSAGVYLSPAGSLYMFGGESARTRHRGLSLMPATSAPLTSSCVLQDLT